MDVTFLGHSSFKIKENKTVLVTDPFDPEMVGLKFPNVEADIVTISHKHKDHDRQDLVGGKPVVISGPGEYEVKDVGIIGIPTFHDSQEGRSRGDNVIYVIEFGNIRLVHLGDLGHELSDDILGRIGEVDVLMVPVGGEFTIGPKVASDVVASIEPRVVIPMHYRTPKHNAQVFGKLLPVEDFLSQIGKEVEKMDTLKIKGESLDEDTKIVVLS